MWSDFDRALRESWSRTVEMFAATLPGLLVLVVVLAVAIVIGLGVRLLLVRALRGLDLDRRAEGLGLPRTEGPGAKTLVDIIGMAAFWFIILLALLIGLTAFNAPLPNRLAMGAFDYLPRLIGAFVIFAVGLLTARFLARTVLIGAVNMRLMSARAVSLLTKWVVLVLATAMALEHLQIGQTVLVLAFGILFGGLVLAMALAVGLGAKDAVRRAIDRQTTESTRPADKLDHV